ncbi:MAG: VWA domain-containing protein [Bacteroidota bacterium]
MAEESSMIRRYTSLSHNLIAFGRYLRAKGLPVSPTDIADAMTALQLLPPDDPARFQLMLRASLTKSPQEQALFDLVYEDYWRQVQRAVDSKIKTVEVESEQKPKRKKPEKRPDLPNLHAIKDWLKGGQESEEEAEMATYSAVKVLGNRDFSSFTEEELSEIMEVVEALARKLATRYDRRYRKSPRRNQLDLRGSIRKNLQYGTDIVDLTWRDRKMRRMKLVVLCDVSKSMELYSRFLVQFIYGFQHVYKRIRSFVFGTEVHEVSESLRDKKFTAALQKMGDQVMEWGSGTRIGHSLRQFLETPAGRRLDHQTIVMILSDGWDTGEPEVLEESMKEIHQKAAGVIWLNPLAGSAAFSPEAKGMEVAMPYIDVFASAHSIGSLKEILRHLRKVEKGRIRRRQAV